MSALHKLQRALLAISSVWLGAFSLAALLVPKYVAQRALGINATAALGAFEQLGAGARLALALIAAVAAMTPRPPRPLVMALALGLLAGVVGVQFNRVLLIYSVADVKPFSTWLWIDGGLGLALAATETARWALRKR